MDDYNVSVLSEAKNEYSTRLVNILTPLIVEGVKSIFDEAVNLCRENDEDEKYLMTFQNFLSRIPKWNSAIIEEECKRILKKSGCSYLEDLLTCVHITQLKILTSIRVSSKQKKIDVEIPKLDTFIHRVYISFARKLYKNVYLFETNVGSLSYQKNMRECDVLCKESVLEVIRDNMPVESILKAYMDETIEEDIIEETVEEIVNKKMDDEETKSEMTGGNSDNKEDDNMENESDVKIVKKSEENNDSVQSVEKDETTIKVNTEHLSNNSYNSNNSEVENSKQNVANQIEQFKDNLELKIDEIRDTLKSNTEEKKNITFNDNDNVLDMGTNRETVVEAPKTIDRLDQIQTERHEQRKLDDDFDDEEDDDEKLNIMGSVGLGDNDFESLDINKMEPKIDDDLELDFEELV